MCGCSTSVVRGLPKPVRWVRLPSPAPHSLLKKVFLIKKTLKIYLTKAHPSGYNHNNGGEEWKKILRKKQNAQRVIRWL